MIERIKDGADIRFTVITCLDVLKNELQEVDSDKFRARVKDRLISLYDIAKESEGKLIIKWYAGNGITTFVSGDEQALMWFKKNNHENVWISLNGTEMTSALRQNTIRITNEIELDKVLNYLSLNEDKAA